MLISTQHAEGLGGQLPDVLWAEVVTAVLPEDLYDAASLRENFYVNPTGRFVIGGPVGDTGLTGRKIIVDTYGGMGRHGGGALSGKDPSKVDRSAAYAARHVAKNVVAAGLADRAEMQVAYAIGMARPLSLHIDTFGTEKIPRPKILELVRRNFDLRRARCATTSTCSARSTVRLPLTGTSAATSPASKSRDDRRTTGKTRCHDLRVSGILDK